MLNWIRHNAPDLRIAHVNVDGKRESFARFSWAGQAYELETAGDDHDEGIVRIVADTLREAMGLPPLFGPDERSDLEEQIVLASLAGDESIVKNLTNRLVTLHAKKPRALAARTRFSAREVW